MKILKAYYDQVGGYPLLRLKLEGFEPLATVDGEAYRHLIGREWNAVFLGADFADLVPPIVRNSIPLAGFTDDAEVVRLAKQFIDDLSNRKFENGKVLVNESGSEEGGV